MKWKKWKLGALVSVILSLFVAMAGVAGGITWQGFAAVLGTALVTHFGSFLKDHPVESIEFDTDTINKP